MLYRPSVQIKNLILKVRGVGKKPARIVLSRDMKWALENEHPEGLDHKLDGKHTFLGYPIDVVDSLETDILIQAEVPTCFCECHTLLLSQKHHCRCGF